MAKKKSTVLKWITNHNSWLLLIALVTLGYTVVHDYVSSAENRELALAALAVSEEANNISKQSLEQSARSVYVAEEAAKYNLCSVLSDIIETNPEMSEQIRLEAHLLIASGNCSRAQILIENELQRIKEVAHNYETQPVIITGRVLGVYENYTPLWLRIGAMLIILGVIIASMLVRRQRQ